MPLVRPPANPVVAVSRALKRWSLAQGPHGDFRVSGKDTAAVVILLSDRAHKVIAAHAEDIMRDTVAHPWVVQTRTEDGRTRTAVLQAHAAEQAQTAAQGDADTDPAPEATDTAARPLLATQRADTGGPRMPSGLAVARVRTMPRDIWAAECIRCTGNPLIVSAETDDPGEAAAAAWAHYEQRHRSSDDALSDTERDTAAALAFSSLQHDALTAAAAGRLMEDAKGMAYEDVTARKPDTYRTVAPSRVVGLIEAGFLQTTEEGGRRWFTPTAQGADALRLWDRGHRTKAVTYAPRDQAHRPSRAALQAWKPVQAPAAPLAGTTPAPVQNQEEAAAAPLTPTHEREGRTVHNGREIVWRTVEGNRFGETFDLVRYRVNGIAEADGQPLQGMPGQTPESVIRDLTRSMDQIDAQFSPYVRVFMYRPGTAEPCPRTAGLAYGHHRKPVGADCPEPKCVLARRKAARGEARRTGITGSAISGLLAREGFTRAELRHDGTARGEGFVCTGEDHNARVAVLWSGPGLADGLAGELPRIAAALMRKGYRVETSKSGRYLVVFAPGSKGTGEREYQERRAGTPAPGWEAHPGAQRADIREARRLLAEATGFVDQAAEDADAPDGFTVTAEGWRGVCVTWGVRTELPRGATARAEWDAALDRIAEALTAAGYTCLQRNQVCVKAVPPLQTTARTVAYMEHRGGLDSFADTVRLEGVGSAGYVELHSSYAHAGVYAYDHNGAQVGGNHKHKHAAVIALAHHYGLPFPLALLQNDRNGSPLPSLVYDAGACRIDPHTAA
ncbi:hypothetical protein ACIPRL_07925 [Streptomyces sp. NPDC090085]|uniref:hypothetical protein n=1 Tax=Streptomyces sp. NPDC090085 TaxID=3365943 RepID=UPI003806FE89